MSDVFVSYKREDEARIASLVRALESQGFSVWWDQRVPGGEDWRDAIERALDAAACVIVVWTQASVGREGGFVRDEASRARARGVLVPVLLDRVDPPLGFGELQAIDLTRWRGRHRDPAFRDLTALIRAKRDGLPVPSRRGATKRMRQLAATGAVAAIVGWVGIALDLGLQDWVCTVPLGQPFVSDTCGWLHLGGRPRREERIAWEASDKSCTALEAHRRRFEGGAYYAIATARLSTRRVLMEDHWVTAEHRLPLDVGRDAPAARTEQAARTAALERGTSKAEGLCRDFAAIGSHRMVAATPEPLEWRCTQLTGGFVCGFEGRARCAQEENQPVAHTVCD